jgi:ATP-dependent Clp protease ATP-binding subunit ClpA
MQDGILALSQCERIIFADILIIMTSNSGAEKSEKSDLILIKMLKTIYEIIKIRVQTGFFEQA